MNEMFLKAMKEEEIDDLTKIMTRAFDYDSMLFLGKNGGPEGYNDGSFIRKWGLNKDATPLSIYFEEKLIGLTILWIREDNYNFLGCLFLDPDYENKGLGVRVWKEIERRYPDTKVWGTETPIFSHRNHHFYINKCGFHCVKIENPKDYNEGSFIFEKVMKK